MTPVITLFDAIARNPLYRLSAPVSLTMNRSEHWAIVGKNGAGKSLLTDTLIGKIPLLFANVPQFCFPGSIHVNPLDAIQYIIFRDAYDTDNNYYYQKRWNSQDADTSPYVRELLDISLADDLLQDLMSQFDVTSLLNKRLVQLSSGELRKMQLIKALLKRPSLLVVDNPFIGLDAVARLQFTEFLSKLASSTTIQLIVILPRTDVIPDFITHVVSVENRVCRGKVSREEFMKSNAAELIDNPLDKQQIDLLQTLSKEAFSRSSEVIRMNDVSVAYGEHTLLHGINWVVKQGEKWAVTGRNGTGKSTLLSLLCADNPQAYACDIHLFGRKRGTGETIWDIKKRIGYLSPEMHRAYLKNLPVIDIVASGFNDSVGMYRHASPQELQSCRAWLEVFGLTALEHSNFLQLSSGEQRLILLVRAFVKSPELLILDEPFHGLDEYNVALAGEIIGRYSSLPGKTLIMVSHYEDEFPSCITHKLSLNRSESV